MNAAVGREVINAHYRGIVRVRSYTTKATTKRKHCKFDEMPGHPIGDLLETNTTDLSVHHHYNLLLSAYGLDHAGSRRISIPSGVADLGHKARLPTGIAVDKPNNVTTSFDIIEELRAALVEFARHYNETWLVARHGYRTPAQVRADQCLLDQNAVADLMLTT